MADERAQSLVDGWKANSMGMGGTIKGQIDRAVAATLFQGDSKKAMTQNRRALFIVNIYSFFSYFSLVTLVALHVEVHAGVVI